MRSQQQAERAEQQRIKNLVLNYDLNDDNNAHDGTEEPAFHYVLSPSSKRSRLVGKGTLNRSLPMTRTNVSAGGVEGGQSQHSTSPATNTATMAEKRNSPSPFTITITSSAELDKTHKDSFANKPGHIDHPHSQPRADKSGNTRSKQRARKLQMGDIDWYAHHRSRDNATPTEAPAAQHASLDDFVREKRARGGDKERRDR